MIGKTMGKDMGERLILSPQEVQNLAAALQRGQGDYSRKDVATAIEWAMEATAAGSLYTLVQKGKVHLIVDQGTLRFTTTEAGE